jgi:glycosyltransferase involved in cell wall biosynthesis
MSSGDTHARRVSVIVPVRNGRRDLDTLIDALKRQTLPADEFEIVIADDGSTDGSTAGLATPDGWIRVEPGPPLNSYAARNRAVRASRGEILAFCDADCRPEPEWLAAGIEALATTDIVAGRIRFDVSVQRTIWTLLDMEAAKDHERQVLRGTAETANLFLLRTWYDRVGGFDDTLPEHGDFDFVGRCLAAGARLDYAAEAVVWHPTRTRAKSFLRAVWIYNRWYAAREARAGRTPEALRLRSLVPVVQPFRARRRWRLSFGPDRRWLAANGVTPSLRESLLALPLIYVFLPYFASCAQARGWLDGRRLR